MTNNRQNENELREQEAPLKNTDNAFVRVNKDGHPEMPLTEDESSRVNEQTLTDHQNKNDDKK